MQAARVQETSTPARVPAKAVLSEYDNMALWNNVCKTNPANTRPVKKGSRQFTAICSQSQIKAATEQFGVYGRTWGLRKIHRDFDSMKTYELAIFSAEFYFPDGSFEISTSLPIWVSKPKGMLDNDICKKAETDLLTKALSKIGFNADVFMGLFDDNRYINEMQEEFNKPRLINADHVTRLRDMLQAKGIEESNMAQAWNIRTLSDLHESNFQAAVNWIDQEPTLIYQTPEQPPEQGYDYAPARVPVVDRSRQSPRAQQIQAMADEIKQERREHRQQENDYRRSLVASDSHPPQGHPAEQIDDGTPVQPVLLPYHVAAVNRCLKALNMSPAHLCNKIGVGKVKYIKESEYNRVIQWLNNVADSKGISFH